LISTVGEEFFGGFDDADFLRQRVRHPHINGNTILAGELFGSFEQRLGDVEGPVQFDFSLLLPFPRIL